MTTQHRERINVMRQTLSTFLLALRGSRRTTSMLQACEPGDLVVAHNPGSAQNIRRALQDIHQHKDPAIRVAVASNAGALFHAFEQYRSRGLRGRVHVDHAALEAIALDDLDHLARVIDDMQPAARQTDACSRRARVEIMDLK